MCQKCGNIHRGTHEFCYDCYVESYKGIRPNGTKNKIEEIEETKEFAEMRKNPKERKCFECNEDSGSYHFCKDCYYKLKSDKLTYCRNVCEEDCDDCEKEECLPCQYFCDYNYHYNNHNKFCNTTFCQCKLCGRWHDNNDPCICTLNQAKEKPKTYQKKTTTLSKAEKIFADKLEQAIDTTKYRLNYQTSFRQLVEKVEKWRWAHELNKDIDFAIMCRETAEVVLLIEYDDSTHDRPDRKARDEQVDSIAKEAGLELIHIKRNDDMSVDYLKGKLENYLD